MNFFYIGIILKLFKLEASKNPDIFYGNNLYDKIKLQWKIIYSSHILQFNRNYSIIIHSINELITNLKNKTFLYII